METKYYKVVGEGCKTKEGYQWHPGKWNIEKNGNVTDDVCGVGLHVWKDRPRFDIWPYRPNSTYRVLTVEGLLGEDDSKARFKKVKLEDHPMSLTEILGPEKDGLKGAVLTGADLTRANLTRADLTRANLFNADLFNADLSNANLFNANLSNANLFNADLSNADLSNANLFNADLSNADLSNADLSNADLRRADLSNANLTGAHGLKDCALSGKQRSQIHC